MILALSLSLTALIAQDPAAQDPAAQDPAAQDTAPKKVPEQDEVEITFLANEGFLIRSGRFKVLIDAFIGDPYSGYGALEPDMLEKLVNARDSTRQNTP